MRNSKIKCVSVKEVIMHRRNNATTAIITLTKRYMHILHVCLTMTNVLVGIFWVFVIDQLGFIFRSNVPYDTTGLLFYSIFLEYTDKHIEVSEWHNVTTNQKGQVQINIYDDNGDTFIATLHNVLLANRSIQQVIFHSYVNEFGTYLFI